MPIFELECASCGNTKEVIVNRRETVIGEKCNKCGEGMDIAISALANRCRNHKNDWRHQNNAAEDIRHMND